MLLMSELAMSKCAPGVKIGHVQVCSWGQNWPCPSMLLRSELAMLKYAPEVRTGHVQVCSCGQNWP
ncbi:hypothetical protein DPMN_168228 [Dreissena polymorpha]|uniref:Uncharacterized protein n=1 Tax=Dreissena polymorpha TaxID=45954 RepID=A0A9D4F2W9_DREPO|nr:hypothetical protein DPMN_168228 [Dreissena polymorpha]